MRETIKRILTIIGIFALAILFFACPNEGPYGLQIHEQHGKATVSFSVTDARTVLPQFSLANVASYQLLGGIDGETETVLVESFTGTGTSISLLPGIWNFTLNAYNSDGKHILQGKVANKQINLRGTNQVAFSLSVLNSGTGAIRITLNFPVSAYISLIKTTGDIDSEKAIPDGSGSFVYTESEIAAGDHFINFELYCRDELRTVVSELVLVRSGLTSSKTITLVGDNLKPIPEIIIELAPALNEWELTEQTVLTAANVDKIFTVTETYTMYQWYLDGTLVGTSSTYTFNKPAGVYQLVIVATDGESRSGRCRITVASPLSADVWVNNSISYTNSMSDIHWYSLSVTSGTRYYFWWNDRKDGDGTKTGDIVVGAQYESETTFIFGGDGATLDSGWTESHSFTADQTGTVYVMVIPYNRSISNSGNYGLVYNTSGRKPTYTVTFDANGGIGTVPTQMAIAGSRIIIPGGSEFSRIDYAFTGWNTLADGTGTNYDVGSLYLPTTDITLYAQWIRAYTVTFNANGGSTVPPITQTVIAGSSITLPNGSEFTSRYTFDGWNTLANGTGTNYAAGSTLTPTENITLYAKWYSIVTYNLNGIIDTRPSQQVGIGGSVTLHYGSGLSRPGYAFDGWNTNAFGTGTNYDEGASYTPTGNITLFARWYAVYIVTFNANGGSGNVPSQQVGIGGSITIPNGSGLSRNNYTFSHWKTIGTERNYYPGDSYTPTGNVTFSAQWYLNTIMLNQGVWANGDLSTSYVECWYSISVTQGTTYYIWCNDRRGGDGTKTGDVVVGAQYADSTTWIFGGTDTTVASGWNGRSFTSNRTGVVYIRVSLYCDDGITVVPGSYGIAYSIYNTRP
jgi:uncharacterized repeat protein (TIGR02543 family)